MKRQLVIIFQVLFFTISCTEKQNRDNQLKKDDSFIIIDSTVENSTGDSVRVNEYHKIDNYEVNENLFLNSVFQFCPDINKTTCESECRCDCCSSELLFFKNGNYIFISSCEGDEYIVKGSYSIDSLKIQLISGDTCAMQNYNWALETDKNARPNFVTFKQINRDTTFIEIDNCNGNPILISKHKNETDFGSKTKDLLSEKRLESLNDSIKLILNINFH